MSRKPAYPDCSLHARRRKPLIIIERFRKARFIAAVTGLSLAYQLVFPAVSYALTGGPASPDFASFEPVATTNMVNEFTGQFVYNIPVLEIPGANGGGYALSLSYHSGDGPETEASWVGSGWTLNPGSINRIKRGVPDDYKGKDITYYNSVPKNWTVAATFLDNLQIYSNLLSVGSASTVRYNNYKGFGFVKSYGVSVLNGLFSLGYQMSQGDGTYSIAVNPAAILSFAAYVGKGSPSSAGSQSGRQILRMAGSAAGQFALSSVSNFVSSVSSSYANYLLTDMTAPYNLTPYNGTNTAGSVSMTYNPGSVQIGMAGGAVISYSSQQNIGERDVPTYGYMYSGNAPSNQDYGTQAVMDYTIENESPFNPRDKYMPVPTSTPDAYFVSGEGLGGAFRMYNDHIGVFSPNFVYSETEKKMFGSDFHMGFTFGKGGETYKSGNHTLTVRPSWTDGGLGNTASFRFAKYDTCSTCNTENEVSEPMFFRFNNDLGGKVLYDDNDEPAIAVPTANGPYLPTGIKEIKKDGNVPEVRRSGRSTYIGYHTNGELRKKNNGVRSLAYEQNERVNILAGRNNSANSPADEMIGEVSSVNEDGNTYVYGLPVYAANEKNIMKGLSSHEPGNYWGLASIHNSTKVGEEYKSPYITSYLLTQITTPDYLDVNSNGPDKEDFGGYTRFAYKQLYGADNKNYNSSSTSLYRWRTPFFGVYYNKMRLSDNSDNLGSYQSGYKEVYILDTIDTKTHYAVFVTSGRLDAYPANPDEDSAAYGRENFGDTYNGLKKLDAICLYAKSTETGVPDKLIKKVRFQYDYTSWPGIPNNPFGTSANTGKLTLKRVWFEYNGVVNASISPYEFQYTYPTVAYPSKYDYIHDEMNLAGLQQTPSYTNFIDCWGNLMYDGENRRNKLLCSADQNAPATFDPAAWQLKQIILPSGGEIHVQYEQNSYAYVQDKHASVMVSLDGDPEDLSDASKFYLNLDNLDIDPGSTSEKQRLVDAIKDAYKPGGDLIYYKFFYTLKGNGEESGIGSTCNGDYVDGFAHVLNAGIGTHAHSGDVFIELDQPIPYKTCIDYVQKEVGGKICGVNNAPSDPGTGKNVAAELTGMASSFINAVLAEVSPKTFYCKALNPDLSYFRIPTWRKHGGGNRVKRLLMYNKGIDVGTESLYGTEYIYENQADGSSYGVATNEPPESKDENPMVTYLDKRSPQSKRDRRHQGRDVDQFRGPLSMNALPGPSIGYSRIIKRNIHQDQYTGTGFTVIDYYTAKDYPYQGYYKATGKEGTANYLHTAIDKGPNLKIGLFSYTISSSMSMSQAYCFMQNQMHGQLKAVSDYPGSYDLSFFSSLPNPVSQKSYEYFEPGEMIPMYDFNTYTTYLDNPGKETDITVDSRGVEDVSNETRITWDGTMGYIPPYVYIPYPIAFPITSTSTVNYNAIVTNKVIHYPAIIKRTSVMKDGFTQNTDNVAFDPLTTQPVLTRTWDSYDGLKLYANPTVAHIGAYTQYSVPASSQYPEMGQKAWNEHYALFAGTGQAIIVTGSGPYSMSGVNYSHVFKTGDLVALHGSSGAISIANVTAVTGVDLTLEAAQRYNTTIPAASYDKIEIIRSGYTNQLKASMGGMLEYGGTFPDGKKNQVEFVKDMNIALTAIINASINSPSTDDSVTVPLAGYRGDLIYWDYVEHCEHMEQKVGYIKLFYDGSSGDFYLDMYDPAGNHMPYPHGFHTPWYFTSVVSGLVPPVKVPNGFCLDGLFVPNSPGWEYIHIQNYLSQDDETFPLKWCHTTPEIITEGIIKASVTTYKDEWDYDTMVYKIPAAFNDYEGGRKGKWRPYETYVFDDTTFPGSNPALDQRNYRMAGVSPNFLKAPWSTVFYYIPKLWVKTNYVSSYSPDGYALEEKNTFDVATSAKFGYNGMLPYAMAKKAPNASVRFESFENNYLPNYRFEDGVIATYNGIYPYEGHTGRRCFQLNDTALEFKDVLNSSGQGHIIRFWVRSDSATVIGDMTVKAGATSQTIKYIGRTGNWALFEVRHTGSATHVTYSFKTNSHGISHFIDDIRIQPVGSQVTAYVYDIKTYKLSAVFDDAHFPTVYQYNGEGKLVRKIVETLVGTRPVEEAQYHTPQRVKLKDIQ